MIHHSRSSLKSVFRKQKSSYSYHRFKGYAEITTVCYIYVLCDSNNVAKFEPLRDKTRVRVIVTLLLSCSMFDVVVCMHFNFINSVFVHCVQSDLRDQILINQHTTLHSYYSTHSLKEKCR